MIRPQQCATTCSSKTTSAERGCTASNAIAFCEPSSPSRRSTAVGRDVRIAVRHQSDRKSRATSRTSMTANSSVGGPHRCAARPHGRRTRSTGVARRHSALMTNHPGRTTVTAEPAPDELAVRYQSERVTASQGCFAEQPPSRKQRLFPPVRRGRSVIFSSVLLTTGLAAELAPVAGPVSSDGVQDRGCNRLVGDEIEDDSSRAVRRVGPHVSPLLQTRCEERPRDRTSAHRFPCCRRGSHATAARTDLGSSSVSDS